MKTSKTAVALLMIIAGIMGLQAQNISTPYSMYGYGILGDRATSMQRQMGGVGYALSSGRQINVMNPASYAAIDSLTFLFDLGADLSFIHSTENGAKANSTGGGLDYITMQFPLSDHFGGSIGLLPYSGVGYAFGNDVTHGTLENQGSGGINMAYLGFAGRIAGFSLGFNVSYNFGNIVNDVYTNPSNSGRSLFEHVMQVRDWDINIGAQYAQKITKNDKITLGLTYSPKKSMHGNSWATIQELTQESLPDTVGSLKLGGNYYTPTSIGAGINYTHARSSRLVVELDFLWQEWSKAKYSPLTQTGHPDNIIFSGMNFNNRTRYAVGAEYVPKIRGSYLQRVAYRIGGFYTDDYLNINGNGVREYGLTCGFGLNTPQDKTVINIGFEWRHRQAHPQKLIGENYFNITLGVNFNELWFYQRKIR
ncbi:MAG: outer membrane protein transport protein [Muribaculum sp.]|nr:outer membrane protein transport protein [Muribaculum sp.]